MPVRVLPLNIISPDAEEVYFGPIVRCVNLHRANSLGDLRAVLEQRLGGPTSPVTLDLMGHSTRDHHLLRLGDDRIDMLDPFVARFFRSLADEHLLPRLEVVAMRLLGCETAVSPGGKRTLRLLARTTAHEEPLRSARLQSGVRAHPGRIIPSRLDVSAMMSTIKPTFKSANKLLVSHHR
jgi:hypothetical protein